MTSTKSDDKTQILKMDARGRVRTPAERREAILDEFERSGMSGVGFARHCGIKYPTFAAWRQRRRRLRSKGSRNGKAVALAEVVIAPPAVGVEPASAQGCLRIELPGGACMCVRGPQEAGLAAVIIQALRGSGAVRC